MGDRAFVAVSRGATLLGVVAVIGSSRLGAQKRPAESGGKLSVPWIMRGPELVGREPSDVRWSPDGRAIYFHWLPPGTSWREPLEWFRVTAEPGARPEALSKKAADSLGPLLTAGATSRDGRRRAVSYDGDLFLIDLPGGGVRRLTNTPSVAELDPSFDGSSSRLFFRRDRNLFAFDLVTFGVTQLTDLRPGPAPDSAKKSGQRAFLEKEEKSLIESVRERAAQDSVDQADRKAREAGRIQPAYLLPNEQVAEIVPAPSGTHGLVLTSTAGDLRRTQVPNYVTASGYTEPIEGRTKVGDASERRRAGLVSFASGKVQWLRPLPNDSSGVYGHLLALGWNDAGSAALLSVLSADYTRRTLIRVDTAGGRLTELEVVRDSAWVGGPCSRCGGWLPGDGGVWFVSEADGYAHLYTVRGDGSGRQQRTRGNWEVLAAELTADRAAWALHTSEPSPFERHFYLLPVDGSPLRRITQAVGGHTVTLAPDGRLLADVFSTSNRPPELYLAPASGGPPSQLTTSSTPEWRAFSWIDPEIVSVPASDGAKVPARIYRPERLGAKPNGAAVIFVHGAGYLHNVHRYWSSYFREFMFNHLLAQRGYVVLDLDYRASAGYGRDWRTAIYRHMGGRDLEDQVDGARYLNGRFGVSFDRIGLYGGSYGGFITLMALFTRAKYFGAGAALRSVTDWAHYNHPYTASILNEPADDSTAYRQSSPIYFAGGLEDPLLMAHGMVDTNVHFQDIVRLTERLVELGKTRWELAVYPVEDHGFVRPDSWTDEYRRILELFDRWLPKR